MIGIVKLKNYTSRNYFFRTIIISYIGYFSISRNTT